MPDDWLDGARFEVGTADLTGTVAIGGRSAKLALVQMAATPSLLEAALSRPADRSS